jgi:hypothetical protein
MLSNVLDAPRPLSSWRRLVLVVILAAAGGCGGGLLAARWTAPETIWIIPPGLADRGPSGLPTGTVVVQPEPPPWWCRSWERPLPWVLDLRRASLSATLAGLACGALLGWLVARGVCWAGRRWRRSRVRASGVGGDQPAGQ